MKKEIDILILFADADNKTPSGGMGWVTQFKRFLDMMLIQTLEVAPSIVLKGEFDSHIAPGLGNVSILIPIVSPHCIKSQKCMENIGEFIAHLSPDAKKHPPILKVYKTPVKPQEQPDSIRDLIGYEMFSFDPESGEIGEYTDYFTSQAEQQYWMKMVDLAYDIQETLQQLSGQSKGNEIKNIHPKKNIYLAETTPEISVHRNIIKRELLRHGYPVYPTQTLPGTAAELESFVKREMDKCQMSIHFIGAAYGDAPEGTDISYVDIQNRIAAERSQKARDNHEDFSRLIWILPNLSGISEKQKSFIENIKRDVEAQEGAEILQTPLEDFKNIMRGELVSMGERSSHAAGAERSVYLMHDRVDEKAVRPIADAISKSGFRVLVPSFEGELLDVRKRHIDHLRNFDAAIIYKGKVNDQWLRMKALDLMKAPGFGRKKPIIGKALITEPGTQVDKGIFQHQNVQFFQGNPVEVTDSIQAFLKEIQ